MKKLIFLCLFLNINSQQIPGNSKACEQRYREAVKKVISDLETQLHRKLLIDSDLYINETLERAKARHNVEVLERTWLPYPEIQGILRAPYENYSHCLDVKLLNPQVSQEKECKEQYKKDKKIAMIKLKQHRDYVNKSKEDKRQLRKAARQYMLFVEKQTDVDIKKLLLERNTKLEVEQLQGKLYEPFTNYLKCLDPKLVIPLVEKR